MGMSFPAMLRSRAMPAGAARPRSGCFHVLVQAQGLNLAGPDGRRLTGFQTWRVVRAESAVQAEALARRRVAEDWGGAWAGGLPELRVVASARLGWLARLAARDTPFEFDH